MRFRAEVHRAYTRDLTLDLGEWGSKRKAEFACFSHMNQLLVWEERSFGFWQARTERHWYQIVVVQD